MRHHSPLSLRLTQGRQIMKLDSVPLTEPDEEPDRMIIIPHLMIIMIIIMVMMNFVGHQSWCRQRWMNIKLDRIRVITCFHESKVLFAQKITLF